MPYHFLIGLSSGRTDGVVMPPNGAPWGFAVNRYLAALVVNQGNEFCQLVEVYGTSLLGEPAEVPCDGRIIVPRRTADDTVSLRRSYSEWDKWSSNRLDPRS